MYFELQSIDYARRDARVEPQPVKTSQKVIKLQVVPHKPPKAPSLSLVFGFVR